MKLMMTVEAETLEEALKLAPGNGNLLRVKDVVVEDGNFRRGWKITVNVATMVESTEPDACHEIGGDVEVDEKLIEQALTEAMRGDYKPMFKLESLPLPILHSDFMVSLRTEVPPEILTIVKDVRDMKASMVMAGMVGPYKIHCSPAWVEHLDEPYGGTVRTLRQRLMEIPDVELVYAVKGNVENLDACCYYESTVHPTDGAMAVVERVLQSIEDLDSYLGNCPNVPIPTRNPIPPHDTVVGSTDGAEPERVGEADEPVVKVNFREFL